MAGRHLEASVLLSSHLALAPSGTQCCLTSQLSLSDSVVGKVKI